MPKTKSATATATRPGKSTLAAKPKAKKEAVAKKAGTSSLMAYLPMSLTVAVGAKADALTEISDATGTDFLSEFRPVTELILKAGIPAEEIQELWVGSNAATNEKAVCFKTEKPYDRELVNQGLQARCRPPVPWHQQQGSQGSHQCQGSHQ